jgi:outer membrane protein assembly factor BamB
MTTGKTDQTAPIVTTLPGPAYYMCGLTFDGTLLWHSDQDAKMVYAIDPGDGHVIRQFDCAKVRADLTYDGRLLCQVGGRPKRVVLLEPEDGSVVGEKPVPPASGRLTGLEWSQDGFWMILRGPTTVQLRDHETMTVRRQFPAMGEFPSGLTYADGVVVYGDFEEGTLHAMDPASGKHLGSASTGSKPTGLTWDGRHLWYCDFPATSFRAIALASVLD